MRYPSTDEETVLASGARNHAIVIMRNAEVPIRIDAWNAEIPAEADGWPVIQLPQAISGVRTLQRYRMRAGDVPSVYVAMPRGPWEDPVTDAEVERLLAVESFWW